MDAKRGFVPEDERNFSPEAISTLKTVSRQQLSERRKKQTLLDDLIGRERCGERLSS